MLTRVVELEVLRTVCLTIEEGGSRCVLDLQQTRSKYGRPSCASSNSDLSKAHLDRRPVVGNKSVRLRLPLKNKPIRSVIHDCTRNNVHRGLFIATTSGIKSPPFQRSLGEAIAPVTIYIITLCSSGTGH